jgi:rhodanese-related sulfurtransferase
VTDAIVKRQTVDQLLVSARQRLLRLSPREAAIEQREGALLVDIRPEAQRGLEGEIPGSLVIERNVLEWRLDPSSDARLDEARGYDVRVIVFCSQGYTSSLAAASLQDLGLWRATDIEGGFLRWRVAGLPTARTTTPAGQYVAGSRRDEL